MIRPALERLESRTLLNVDFKEAFALGTAGALAVVSGVGSDAAGNLYATGYFTGTVKFGVGIGFRPISLTSLGKADAFVAKYTAGGRLNWAIDLGGTQTDTANAIAVDATGDAAVTGSFEGTATFGSFTLTVSPKTGANTFDAFVVKVAPTGSVVWAKRVGSNVNIGGESVAFNPSGGVNVAGIVAQLNGQGFALGTDSNGSTLWLHNFAGNGGLAFNALAVDPAGAVLVGGFFTMSVTLGSTTLVSAGNSDGLVMKLDSNGTVLWAKGFGGANVDNMGGLGEDALGNVYATGYVEGTASFGPGLTVSTGGQHNAVIVAKYSGLGTPLWVRAAPATGTLSYTAGSSIAVDPAGNSYTAGIGAGLVDFDPGPGSYVLNLAAAAGGAFVWKLDAAGRLNWVRSTAGTGETSPVCVALGTPGKVLFGGAYQDGTVALGAITLPDIAMVGGINAFISVLALPVANDFDNDGRADLALFRPSSDLWSIRNSSGIPTQTTAFGGPGDVPVPANYGVTGATSLAVFRPPTAVWNSTAIGTVQFGAPGLDRPVPADYDGDGRADLAVFRPTTSQWFINRSTLGPQFVQFGGPGDQPVPADYDGDGKTDVAVYDPRTATWFILGSTAGPFLLQFGAPGLDVPVPADYTGDGRADLAVYRPGAAQWFIRGAGAFSFGAPSGDLPVPADYAGTGRAQLAVYRPATGQWFVSGVGAFTFGQPGDLPLELPLAYRAAFFGRSVHTDTVSAPAAATAGSILVPLVDPSAETTPARRRAVRAI